MRLGQKQELFSMLLPVLLNYIHACGYSVRMGYLQRCEECPVGIENSCHKMKIAIDLNLFFDGKFLTSTRDHRRFGEFWERLHPLCRWGGRFKDGNHYSLEHNGVK